MNKNKRLKTVTAGRSNFLLPAMYCLVLCAAMLVSCTFAWFHQNVKVKDNKIVAGDYGVTVTVTVEGEDNQLDAESDGSYTLSGGKSYTVTLTATGTAEKGYCTMTVVGTDNDKHTYTYSPALLNVKENDEIKHGTITFTLTLGNSVDGVEMADWKVSFAPSWGTCDVTDSVENKGGVIQIGTTVTDTQ